MFQGIRHIIFDLGNVILNIEPQLSLTALQSMAKNPDSFEETYKKLVQEGLFERFEIGEISSSLFIESLKTHFREEITEEQIIQAWNKLLLDFPLRRLQVLQQLQVHYDMVLLSNTNSLHEAAFNEILLNNHSIPNIGVFFDRVYYSHKLGLRKPDEAIFQLVLEECGFQPEKTLFIDDTAEHIRSAERLGIKTIWLEKGMSIEKDIFLPLSI